MMDSLKYRRKLVLSKIGTIKKKLEKDTISEVEH